MYQFRVPPLLKGSCRSLEFYGLNMQIKHNGKLKSRILHLCLHIRMEDHVELCCFSFPSNRRIHILLCLEMLMYLHELKMHGPIKSLSIESNGLMVSRYKLIATKYLG